MKRRIYLSLLLLVASLSTYAQIPATPDTLNGKSVSSNFNGFISQAGGAAPAHWAITGQGTRGDSINLGSGTPNAGGWYFNQNVGFHGSANATNGMAVWAVYNNSATPVNTFSITFNQVITNQSALTNPDTLFTEYSISPTYAPGTFINVPNLRVLKTNANNTLRSQVINVAVPQGSYVFVRFRIKGGVNTGLLGVDNVTVANGTYPTNIINVYRTLVTDSSARFQGTTRTAPGVNLTQKGVLWNSDPGIAFNQTGVHKVNMGNPNGNNKNIDTNMAGLPAGTKIYFKLFAITAADTGVSDEGILYTLAKEVAGPVTNLLASAVDTGRVSITWDTVARANGYLIAQRITQNPNVTPLDTVQYALGATMQNASKVVAVINGNLGATTITGLTGGTIYAYQVIPFSATPGLPRTTNYWTKSANPFDTARTPAYVPAISFIDKAITVTQRTGDSAKVYLRVTHRPNPPSPSVKLYVKGGTAVNGVDYTAIAAAGVTVSMNVDTKLYIVWPLTNYKPSGPKTLQLVMRSPIRGIITADSLITITFINPSTYIPANINALKPINATTGVKDSASKYYSVNGTLQSGNFGVAPIMNTFINDGTNGINIYHATKNFGQTLQEGDSVNVKGQLLQTNGMIQIVPDTMIKLATGIRLKAAKNMLTALSDTNESNLVVIKHAKYANGWSAANATFNANFTVGALTYSVAFIRAVCNVPAAAPNANTFYNITGICIQNDNTNPYLQTYRIQPRKLSDFALETAAGSRSFNKLDIYPNPARGNAHINLSQAAGSNTAITISNLAGKVVYTATPQAGSFSDVLPLQNLAKGLYMVTVTYGDIPAETGRLVVE